VGSGLQSTALDSLPLDLCSCLRQMQMGDEGWIPLLVVANCRRVCMPTMPDGFAFSRTHFLLPFSCASRFSASQQMQMDDEGWIPLSVVANFRRVCMLTPDFMMIVDALRDSDVVEVRRNVIGQTMEAKCTLSIFYKCFREQGRPGPGLYCV